MLFLTDSSVASLRQTKRRIDLLRSMDLPRDAMGVVVNRMEKKLFQSIGSADIEATLRTDVVATLSADPQIAEAQEQGVTIDRLNRRSKFARDIEALADMLLGTED